MYVYVLYIYVYIYIYIYLFKFRYIHMYTYVFLDDERDFNHAKTWYMAYGFAFGVPVSLYKALIK